MGARRTLNHLHVRIAVSEAAAWTGRRFFGGRYRVIPNGVHVDAEARARAPPTPRARIGCGSRSSARRSSARGCPCCCAPSRRCASTSPRELTVIGPGHEELAPLLMDDHGVRVLGKVDDERKHAELGHADVLCAPSLGGERFGMVLTEAFAAGTPVIASDIAGYRDVVREGVDGVLVPPGDAQALAEALRDLWEEPERRAAMARAAAADVARFAWPQRRRARCWRPTRTRSPRRRRSGRAARGRPRRCSGPPT